MYPPVSSDIGSCLPGIKEQQAPYISPNLLYLEAKQIHLLSPPEFLNIVLDVILIAYNSFILYSVIFLVFFLYFIA